VKKSILAAIGVLAITVAGHSATLIFTATLNGASERPNPVATSATGTATLTVDSVTGSWNLVGNFSGLLANATAAHIHGAGDVNTVAAILHPLQFTGTTSGTISGGTSANPPNSPYTPQQMADLSNQLHYVNVHSDSFPGGEIRGQLFPIPEPAIFGLGLIGTLLIFRRRTY
jgi:CHRD domain